MQKTTVLVLAMSLISYVPKQVIAFFKKKKTSISLSLHEIEPIVYYIIVGILEVCVCVCWERGGEGKRSKLC